MFCQSPSLAVVMTLCHQNCQSCYNLFQSCYKHFSESLHGSFAVPHSINFRTAVRWTPFVPTTAPRWVPLFLAMLFLKIHRRSIHCVVSVFPLRFSKRHNEVACFCVVSHVFSCLEIHFVTQRVWKHTPKSHRLILVWRLRDRLLFAT